MIGSRTQRYVKSVADLLAAGRYVVAVASCGAAMGLVSAVAIFEMYYHSGFGIEFWRTVAVSMGFVITLTGFAIYRYRETRAMTMGQFFEVHYSKSLRMFAAALQFISGKRLYR